MEEKNQISKLLKYTALSWTLFQVSVASFWELNSDYIRQIHLFFALIFSILFIQSKSPNFGIKLLKILSIIFIFCSTFYYFSDIEAFYLRAGSPNLIDKFIAITFIFILLSCSWLIIGKAITIIASLFLAYSFFASYMPDFLSFKSVSLDRLVGQIFMSSEGIFGIPLDVSANIVFLFVLFGSFLEKTGGGQFFINLALSLVGRYRGGAAKASVIGSGLTGMISGSSIANIVTTGTFTIPLMKKTGYPAEKAAAIEVASSTDGQLAPPIMGAAAFIMAATLKTDYLSIIKAAIIPALTSIITLLFIVHLEAVKNKILPLKKDEIPIFKEIIKKGWVFLFPLIILLYFLIIEGNSALFSVLIAISSISIISFFQLFTQEKTKQKSLKEKLKFYFLFLVDVSTITCKNMLIVALATASAGIIIGVVSLGLGSQVNNIIQFLSFGNIILLLFFTALVSLIVGLGLPTTATYIVISSLTAPVILSTGSDIGLLIPAISAHLFCFYFGILADDTPPVGLAAYTASAIAKSEPIKTGIQSFTYDIRTAIIPFMFILNPEIILFNIDSFFQALFILLMTVFASFAFAAVIQGFLVKKNHLFDIILLLSSSLILFYPKIFHDFFSLASIHHYYFYIIGLLAFALVYLKQKLSLRDVH